MTRLDLESVKKQQEAVHTRSKDHAYTVAHAHDRAFVKANTHNYALAQAHGKGAAAKKVDPAVLPSTTPIEQAEMAVIPGVDQSPHAVNDDLPTGTSGSSGPETDATVISNTLQSIQNNLDEQLQMPYSNCREKPITDDVKRALVIFEAQDCFLDRCTATGIPGSMAAPGSFDVIQNIQKIRNWEQDYLYTGVDFFKNTFWIIDEHSSTHVSFANQYSNIRNPQSGMEAYPPFTKAPFICNLINSVGDPINEQTLPEHCCLDSRNEMKEEILQIYKKLDEKYDLDEFGQPTFNVDHRKNSTIEKLDVYNIDHPFAAKSMGIVQIEKDLYSDLALILSSYKKEEIDQVPFGEILTTNVLQKTLQSSTICGCDIIKLSSPNAENLVGSDCVQTEITLLPKRCIQGVDSGTTSFITKRCLDVEIKKGLIPNSYQASAFYNDYTLNVTSIDRFLELEGKFKEARDQIRKKNDPPPLSQGVNGLNAGPSMLQKINDDFQLFSQALTDNGMTTKLFADLIYHEITDLYFVGMNANYDMAKTIKHARELNFNVTIISDAVQGKYKAQINGDGAKTVQEQKTEFFKSMEEIGCNVTTMAELQNKDNYHGKDVKHFPHFPSTTLCPVPPVVPSNVTEITKPIVPLVPLPETLEPTPAPYEEDKILDLTGATTTVPPPVPSAEELSCSKPKWTPIWILYLFLL